MKTEKPHIGKKIRELITGSKYSVKEVAKRLGICPSSIYKFHKRKSVQTKYLISLAEMFDVPVSYFYQEHEAKKTIDKVTTAKLDLVLRMVGIKFDLKTIDKIIDLVELLEEKGDKTSIEDICELQASWQSLDRVNGY
ncbi:hypothetical protein SDC9_17668 [bioreactor metagenome]|uniref:HTH cro/C1-type domain-containing protein n=1 Tax=bioreactor metagenome TaxID=1076179 RepID=A0A644TZ11_9ZZZZ|nr:helix-turn-helix transcriptional regulator [Lentimicrobium sp.]MEA5111694.1 helix-turn-helix transcriptional regulator [Lentimicrobium sp.]